MIYLLILAHILIKASAELHSADPASHCNSECIGHDADCQIVYQQIPQSGKVSGLHNVIINFLSTGDVKMGSLALQETKEYAIKANQSVTEENIDDLALYNSVGGLQCLLCLQEVLSDLLELAKNNFMLKTMEANWIDVHIAYEETHHHPASAYAVAKTAEKYASVLNAELNAIKSLNFSHNFNELLLYQWISDLLSSIEQKEQLLTAVSMIKTEFSTFVTTVEVTNIYVNPVVYGLIFILGIILNGTLIIMCVRHKELRTPPNIMLFNLAVADILNLIVNVPLAQMFKPIRFTLRKITCRLFLVLRHMSISVSALSIVALSLQRYIAVINAFQVTSDITVFIYILVVWLIALGDGLLNSVILDDPCYTQLYNEGSSKFLDLSNFLLYCVFLPVAMVVISVLTAKKLSNSAKTIPGAYVNPKAEVARYRSARIVASLAIVFLISNIPISLRYVLYSWLSVSPGNPLYSVLMDTIFYFLLFSNSCFNPIALCAASKLFRGYFQRYLFFPFLRTKHTQQPSHTTKSFTDELAIVQLNVKMHDNSCN